MCICTPDIMLVAQQYLPPGRWGRGKLLKYSLTISVGENHGCFEHFNDTVNVMHIFVVKE